ncbi:hypothetical protein Y032_0018g3648 [Ancylostoma ceylanicum]|uniref:Uncharacterized protein n=1 Tax=Ancylostoma ceylanicum TaxID=53326 RepID=A0A016V5J6_9BILA|nr:hypothetical protein Y032_0018g3648 [Ancylostoma ceylanicum]
MNRRYKDRGNDTYRSPHHIAIYCCRTELIASFVWSLILHAIYVAIAGGRGEVWGYSQMLAFTSSRRSHVFFTEDVHATLSGLHGKSPANECVRLTSISLP